MRAHLTVMGDGHGPVVSDRVLAEQAGHDAAAFAQLYERYVDRVYAFAYRRSRSRETAQDVTAATFERALRHIPQFRWQRGGFSAWIHRIAANELVDHYRREQRDAARRMHLAAIADESMPGADEDAQLRRLDTAAVLDAVSRLKPQYQQAISLRYLAALSADEAAAALGCSKPALAVTLHRALAALRREVAGRELS